MDESHKARRTLERHSRELNGKEQYRKVLLNLFMIFFVEPSTFA
jgi:hypothetical protein